MTRELTPITVKHIDLDALKVVGRLQRFGYEAYLVGGCVRDLLLDQQPKDFDVATSATPEQVKKTFRNCRIIGRRFRLAHIFFGAKIIETSTFRAPPQIDPEAEGEEAIIWRDNVFGTAEEDARRRDFTINGLFYDPVAKKVIDTVDGLEDVRAERVRTIGDPRVRFQEDPVRILRAIKFATRLNLSIEENTRQAMVEFRGLIANCATPRVLEEIFRLQGSGHAVAAFRLMHEMGVLAVLFPELTGFLEPPADAQAAAPVSPMVWLPRPSAQRGKKEDPTGDLAVAQRAHGKEMERLYAQLFGDSEEARIRARQWFWAHLAELDSLVASSERPPSHAVLLGSVLASLCAGVFGEDLSAKQAFDEIDVIVDTVANRLGVSRRDRQYLRQILFAQRRMIFRGNRVRPRAMMQRDYYKDALLLLQLGHRATGQYGESLQYWENLQQTKPRRRRRGRGQRRPPRSQ